MPEVWLSEPIPGIGLPGEEYIRLALVPKLEEVSQAAEKIRRLNILTLSVRGSNLGFCGVQLFENSILFIISYGRGLI
jgi:hypothetical protein